VVLDALVILQVVDPHIGGAAFSEVGLLVSGVFFRMKDA
jgi:hypothetical protein